MNYLNPSHYYLHKTNWEMLGQLRLGQDSNPNGTIKAWLRNVLGGVSLPGDLVSRLQTSMEDATARFLSLDSIEGQFEYLEIAVLGPARQTSKGHTWGFFRIERAATALQVEHAKGHCIEYYLYLDKRHKQPD